MLLVEALHQFSSDVNHELQRIVTTSVGEVTVANLETHIEQWLNTVPGYAHLADLSKATLALDTKHVHSLAARMRRMVETCEAGRMAIWVSDDLSFGLARMFCALAYPECLVETFRLRVDAAAWLGWESPSSASAIWRAAIRRRTEQASADRNCRKA